MNMKIVASLLLFGAYAGVCSDIVWSGDVVVPESADVTCTDHGYVTSISLGANSVVRFNTRTAHSFPITGSGKIIKEGDAEWTMTTAIPNFAGDYEIASGVVNVSLGKVFGADDVKHKLVVRKGATLSITAKEGAIIKRHVHIAGDGAPGRFGALEAPAVSTTEHFLDYLYLDGDATLYTPMSGLFFVQGELDLSGFKLTVTGAGQPTLLGCTISKNGGEIYVKGNENEKPTLYLRSWAHDNPTFNIPSSLSPFVMSGFSTISIWDGVKPIGSSLFVSGLNNILTHTTNNKSNHGYVTNHANWAGAVVFTNETGMSNLQVYNGVNTVDKGPCMLSVSGPISGLGSVNTKLWKHNARVAILNSGNSYVGGTYIDNYVAGGSTLLGYPGSIPNENYSSVTANHGYVDLAVGEDYTRWDFDSALKFAANAKFNNGCKPRFSSEFAANGLGSVKFKVEADSPTGVYLGARDAVKFEGTGNPDPIPFCWNAGIAYLTGPQPILLGDTKLSSADESDATNMCVRLEGADVTLDGDSVIYIGQQNSKMSRMTISNSVVRSANFMKGDFSEYSEFGGIAHGSLMAGYRSPGILEMFDGAIVTGRVIACGYTTSGPWNGGGQGAVYQHGGKLVSIGTKQVHYSSGVGMAQADGGYYELNGGTLEARGSFSVGGYGYGCFAQYGGLFTANSPLEGMTAPDGSAVTEQGLRLASCNGGRAEYYMEGGTFKNLSSGHVWIGSGTGTITCNVTLNGPSAEFDCGTKGVFMGMNSHNGTYTFNFNDGVFACGGMRIYRNKNTNGEPLTNNVFYINFNGGTFRAMDDTWSNPFAYGCNGDYSLGPTNVAIYSRGATIDTGCTNVTFNMPLRSAWGKGIKSIELPEPLKSTEYVGSPRVEIVGDGIGASAFAHFDSEKMQVDRIIVTSPGCGYTTATVNLVFHKTVAKTLTTESGAVVLEDNANTGTFTKTGNGSIRLWATNTWGGATIIKGGVVFAKCDWALPSNTVVKIGGGAILDLGNHKAKISRIEYLAGGGKIINTGSSEIPESFSMRTALEDITAGRPIAIASGCDLTGVSIVVEGSDFSTLDKTKLRYRVLKAAEGTFSGIPDLDAAVPPAPWSYIIDKDGIILNYTRGTVVVFR